MVANRVASSDVRTNDAASVAALPPSFQPWNAAIRTGDRSAGRDSQSTGALYAVRGRYSPAACASSASTSIAAVDQRGIERRAGQLVEPAGGGLPRRGHRRRTRAAGTRPRRPSRRRGRRAGSRRRRGRRDSPSRRGARGGGGSRRRPGRAPGRARRGRRRASRGRAGSASRRSRRGRAERGPRRAGPPCRRRAARRRRCSARRSHRPARPAAAIAPARLGHALDVGGRMPLADAGDERDRAGDVLGRAVRHEAEMGVVRHLSGIGAMPRRLERQAGTAAISSRPPTTARPSVEPISASTACSGCGIRPNTLPASLQTPATSAVAPLTSAA